MTATELNGGVTSPLTNTYSAQPRVDYMSKSAMATSTPVSSSQSSRPQSMSALSNISPHVGRGRTLNGSTVTESYYSTSGGPVQKYSQGQRSEQHHSRPESINLPSHPLHQSGNERRSSYYNSNLPVSH